MTELGEIPNEWEIISLDECGKVFGGNAFKSNNFVMECDENYYQVIRMGNVQLGYLDINRNPVYLNKKAINEKEKKYLLNNSDVLISLTGTINKNDYGNVAWVSKNDIYLLNQRVACLRNENKDYNNRYYYYFLQSDLFRKQFFECGVGGTGNQANVSINDISNIKVYKVPINEQEKIASILSTVDEQIDNTEKLIQKNQELKKGLMQQLLTKGIGHTKFKKTELGEIPEEWEVKKLGEIVDVVSGATPKTNIEEYWNNGNIYWATPTDITSNGKYIKETEKSITETGLKNCSAKLLPEGSILMSSRATIGERCINVVPMATNQGFKSLICKNGINNEFIYYYIDILKEKFIVLASGSTFLEISKKIVEDIKVALPSFEEQEKIALILSTVDKKIDQYQNKKEKLEEVKKGLMQQLLTGKIRVM